MKLAITGRHVIITPGIRTDVHKRLRKFGRLFGNNLNFHVIIGVEKDRHTVEIILKSKLLDLAAASVSNDMYSSIIRSIAKLERQALKHKKKLVETKRHRAKAKSVAKKSEIGPSHDLPSGSHNGIHEEEAAKKPMAVEEAVLELAVSDYPFVVFHNADSGLVNILYRRKDGSFGLIYA